MTLLCTAQGTNAQQDGSGAQRVYLHAVDGDNAVHRYWMEAERSKHKVGGEQKETEEEAKEAAARGKATSIHIGTRAMGTRFNVQMLIQVPLQQKPRPIPTRSSGAFGGRGRGGGYGVSLSGFNKCKKSSAVAECEDDESDEDDACDSLMFVGNTNNNNNNCAAKKRCRNVGLESKRKVIGTSNAARVSRGSEFDKWKGVSNKEPARDPSQHATITVTLYYTVAGGIPSEADIEMCVKDLDELYKACPSDKKLVDCGEVTAELTVKDMIDINTKVGHPNKFNTFEPIKSSFPE
eukprot:TRINITY_DN3001_c0_g1_i15.p2 TRINITY_DN3001_c0_g1~~TRINITY_DN3001_c0_g1_i15.p2  ORF type:complete len:293 (+),score=100.13 TRINITY_DN3001_c0_g1_i15:648-1526(+)